MIETPFLKACRLKAKGKKQRIRDRFTKIMSQERHVLKVKYTRSHTRCGRKKIRGYVK